MDRHELIDRLPGERLRQRLPSVWSPREPEDERAPADEEAETPEWEVTPVEQDVEVDEDGTERRAKLRKALLGMSVFGAVLAIGAAVLRKVLGGEEDSATEAGEDAATEPADHGEIEVEEEKPIDEGTAALLGLAFLSAIEAVRDRLLSPTE